MTSRATARYTSTLTSKRIKRKWCCHSISRQVSASRLTNGSRTTPHMRCRVVNSLIDAFERSPVPPSKGRMPFSIHSAVGSTTFGQWQISRSQEMIEPSRPSDGICFNWCKRQPQLTNRELRRRACRPAGTTGTTSGTPRCTSSRSLLTRLHNQHESCFDFDMDYLTQHAGELENLARSARCTRGEI